MTTNKADRPAVSSYDKVTFNGDGSEDFYFGLTQPDDVKRGNWIETGPKKGWS
jgi:hypothetical protein